jgi:hypothetical protein
MKKKMSSSTLSFPYYTYQEGQAGVVYEPSNNVTIFTPRLPYITVSLVVIPLLFAFCRFYSTTDLSFYLNL